MKKSKKFRKMLLLVIVVLAISIGFAFLSSQLGIYGTSQIYNSRWNIHWDPDSVEVSPGSVDATDPVVSTSTNSNDTVTFSADFTLPGEYYEFTIDAQNEGTIDGELDSSGIVKGIYEEDGLTTKTLPDYLEYTVTYDDDATPNTGDVLEAGTSQKYKVRLYYKTNSSEIPMDDDITTYKVVINYQQTTN